MNKNSHLDFLLPFVTAGHNGKRKLPPLVFNIKTFRSAVANYTSTITSNIMADSNSVYEQVYLTDNPVNSEIDFSFSGTQSNVYIPIDENANDSFFLDNDEILANSTLEPEELFSDANWWGLMAIFIVILTALGNILVILAISWDKRLQNMTNYFLLSLAVTDLMVAILVMPIGIVVLILGRFPFSSEVCLLWISLDVLFCSASIMHLCTISVDRFLSLRYPMKFGRHKTRKRVVLKIVLVWFLSLSTSLPLSLMYASDPKSTIIEGICQIPTSMFQIFGSLICFYIPLIIMLVTYALTVHLLSKKESRLTGESMPNRLSPSPRSVRLKRLLCKTTSNFSSATITTLTEPEISEQTFEDSECSHKDSPYRRPPPLRYCGSNYRNSPIRSKQRDNSIKHDERGDKCLASTSSFELNVFPNSFMELPNDSDPPSMSDSPHHQLLKRSPKRFQDSSSEVFESPSLTPGSNIVHLHNCSNEVCLHSCNSKRAHFQKCLRESELYPNSSSSGNMCFESCHKLTEDMFDRTNGARVNVPCSCAPKFFVEGFKDNYHEEVKICEHIQENERTNPATFCCTSLYRRKEDNESTEPATSPWQKETSTGLAKDNVFTSRNKRKKEKKVKLLWKHKGKKDFLQEPECPSASKFSSGSSKTHWRRQSCSPSMRFGGQAQKHGRNIHVERKATKVLGIVFFTFVFLWAPFFVIQILLGASPTFHKNIGDDVINFVTWLGYASSMVNPFFYTFFNKTFRDAFVNVIRCRAVDKRRNFL